MLTPASSSPSPGESWNQLSRCAESPDGHREGEMLRGGERGGSTFAHSLLVASQGQGSWAIPLGQKRSQVRVAPGRWGCPPEGMGWIPKAWVARDHPRGKVWGESCPPRQGSHVITLGARCGVRVAPPGRGPS
ncbi:unnamed protein product [Natator depressus]